MKLYRLIFSIFVYYNGCINIFSYSYLNMLEYDKKHMFNSIFIAKNTTFITIIEYITDEEITRNF